LQCVAVCCSVLQCVAVCCSVLQCVAVCCSVLQCVAVCCSASAAPPPLSPSPFGFACVRFWVDNYSQRQMDTRASGHVHTCTRTRARTCLQHTKPPTSIYLPTYTLLYTPASMTLKPTHILTPTHIHTRARTCIHVRVRTHTLACMQHGGRCV